MESLKTRKLELEIVRRGYDDRWIVNTPASSVRIGETDRDTVRKKDCVDYLRLVTIFIGKVKMSVVCGLTETNKHW